MLQLNALKFNSNGLNFQQQKLLRKKPFQNKLRTRAGEGICNVKLIGTWGCCLN